MATFQINVGIANTVRHIPRNVISRNIYRGQENDDPTQSFAVPAHSAFDALHVSA